MTKRTYHVLNNDLDLLEFKRYGEDTEAYDLQGSAISALRILDSVLNIYNLKGDGIIGVLFAVKSYEFAREFEDMIDPNIYLITNDSIDISIRAYIQPELGFSGLLKTKEEILKAIEDERSFLIYGSNEIIEMVGEENLAENYIPNYIPQEPDI